MTASAGQRRYARGGPIRGPRSVLFDSFDVVAAKPYDGPIRPLMSPYEPDADTARLGSSRHAQVVPRSRYYAGSADLDRLIADPVADIGDVVREVERLCEREAHAATYYREHPDLLHDGHPWLLFVASGRAAHLGWSALGCDNG